MTLDIIYIHGIGVRGDAYDAMFDVLDDRLAREIPEAKLHHCRWGDKFGARLMAEGRSVPDYAHLGTSVGTEPDDNLAAQWQWLYADSFIELKFLSKLDANQAPHPPHLPASERQRFQRLSRWSPGNEVKSSLSAIRLTSCFQLALDELRSWPGLHLALRSESAIAAVGRALIARALVIGTQHGIPAPALKTITSIGRAVAEDIEGAHLSGPTSGWIMSKIAAPVTTALQRRRALLMDHSVPLIGDILIYQAHADKIRARIKESMLAVGKKHVILAHSLGGVAAVELLIDDKDARSCCCQIVTAGSQASFFYEIGALKTLPFGEKLPQNFPRWLNFYDRRDFLAFVGAEIFQPHDIRDIEITSGQPFPQSHSAYWSQDRFWERLRSSIRGGAAL